MLSSFSLLIWTASVSHGDKMKKQTIDSAMARLSEILETLENETPDLETSMKLYEEGVKLVSYCSKTLSEAKQKISKLSENSADE